MDNKLEKIFSFVGRVKNRLVAYVDYLVMFQNWYKFIFPVNKIFAGREIFVYLRNGMTVLIRDSRSKDLSVIREVIGHNGYRLGEIILPEKAVILDVGANIGTFSLMARKYYPTASIYAFEPHPDNFNFLRRNAPFATSSQSAIANFTGEVEFQAAGSPIGLKIMSGGGLKVSSLSLNDVVEGFPVIDLLKLDIEGSEYEVVDSLSNVVFNKIDRFIIEAHPTNRFSKNEGKMYLEDLLSKKAFKVLWIKKNVLLAEKKG